MIVLFFIHSWLNRSAGEHKASYKNKIGADNSFCALYFESSDGSMLNSILNLPRQERCPRNWAPGSIT